MREAFVSSVGPCSGPRRSNLERLHSTLDLVLKLHRAAEDLSLMELSMQTNLSPTIWLMNMFSAVVCKVASFSQCWFYEHSKFLRCGIERARKEWSTRHRKSKTTRHVRSRTRRLRSTNLTTCFW